MGRTDVIELFAFLHDCRRENEGRDSAHGRRAAEYARSLKGSLIHLDTKDFELLEYAMTYHSDGLTEADITIQTCWDADRLDLGRVGKKPDPDRLCTAGARQKEMLEWAYERSIRG